MNKFLIFLILFASTIQYRIDLGAFSFTFLEPVTLIILVYVMGYELGVKKRFVISNQPLVLIFIMFGFLALIIRPIGLDIKSGLSDIRDWIIPGLTLILLTTYFWRYFEFTAKSFIFLGFIYSLLGIYQHLTNSFRPFVIGVASLKTGFTVSPDMNSLALTSYASGFFSHPNNFAIFLFLALMLGFGWEQRARNKNIIRIGIITIIIGLYYTYAKASMLVMLVAIAFYLLQKKIKITELSWVTILGSALVVPAIFVLISKLPAAYLTTFKWRVGLWEIGLKILQHMNILLFGNGMDEFGKIAYYGQPHNLYIYLLLQYGVFGILLLLIMIGIILKMGINIYNIPIQLRDPLLTSSLFGLVGFLIIGLVESNLMGIEMRQIFVIYLSIFIGVYRQNYHQKLFGALNANTNRFAEHSSSI